MFNIFTCLRENKIYAHARERVLRILMAKKDKFVDEIGEYLKEKSPELKQKLIDWIMNNIELGFPYNLFKKSIRKTIDKNFDKLIQFILLKLQEL